jgi:DNA polymerase-3 subunit beta
MKITCNREKLLSAFQTVASVAPTRSPKPILQSVKFEVTGESAILMATDLEIGIRYDVPAVEVESAGSAVLPIQRFGSILRESSDEKLSLESDGSGTTIRGERSEFRLPGQDPQGFPVVAVFGEKMYQEVSARLFREAIRRTSFATDNESSRYALGGVLLELESNKLVAVSTDGRRLAKMEGPATAVGGEASAESSLIVPTRAMNLLERAISDDDGEIQIAGRASEVLVKSPRATIFARLLEGRFPRWRDVFPPREGVASVELSIGPLLSAVRQAAIATSEESRGVDFQFSSGTLVLSAQAADVGQSRVELPIAYEGRDVAITMDPRFVADFLKVLDADKTFTIELKDAESAALLSTDDGYAYVIMPLARDR